MYDFEARQEQAAGDASPDAVTPGDDGIEEPDPERIIEALESTPVRFERLIENRSADELRRAAQDGHWGIVEILSHVLDWEEIFHERVTRILRTSRPELEAHDDTLWAIEHDYGSQDGHAVFARFAGQRQALVEELRGLGEEAWERTAVLEGRGEVSLRGLMQALIEHDLRYVGQARDVLG